MQRKRILFLGYGDIAERTARKLVDFDLVGVARSAKTTAAQVTFIQAAADSSPVRDLIVQQQWDAVVITLTPTEFSDEAYKIGYVQTLERILPALLRRPPGLVLFVSSTGVYSQSKGEWVDEKTTVSPESFSGRRLLEAENLLRDSGLAHSILRLAGIYGPGRESLIRQVHKGKGGSSSFTNRIHSEDCAGFIAYLLEQFCKGETIEPLYVVSDGSPVSGQEVRAWLAEQLGIPAQHLSPSVSSRGGNKRCSNQLMLQSGYKPIYPDFREGYREMLES